MPNRLGGGAGPLYLGYSGKIRKDIAYPIPITFGNKEILVLILPCSGSGSQSDKSSVNEIGIQSCRVMYEDKSTQCNSL